MEFKVENVTIDSVELRKVVSSLENAIERNQKIRKLCEEILTVQEEPSGAAPRRGARASSSAAKHGKRVSGGGRGRGPRGGKTLAVVITEVLQKSRKPLRPGELRDRVLAAGYPTSAKPESFYVAVFNTAKKIPGVIKNKSGFRLKK